MKFRDKYSPAKPFCRLASDAPSGIALFYVFSLRSTFDVNKGVDEVDFDESWPQLKKRIRNALF